MNIDNITNKKQGKRLQIIRLMGSLLSVALLIYLTCVHGIDKISEATNQVTGKVIILAYLLLVMSRTITSIRWHIILKGLDIQIPFLQTLSLTFAGLFAANFLPTTIGGDVARLVGIVRMKHDGVKCAASLVLDRIIGLLGMLIIVPFGIQTSTPLGMTPVLGGMMVFAVIINNDKFRRSFLWTRKSMLEVIKAVKQGVNRPKCMLGALILTLLHMAFMFSSMAVLLSEMGENVPFLLIAGLWSIVYLLALLPISINGLGVQELSAAYVFSHAAGVPITTAMTFAVLARVLAVAATIPGAFCLSSLAIKKRE